MIHYEVWTHRSPEIDEEPAEVLTIIPKDDFALACRVAEPFSGGVDIFRVSWNEPEHGYSSRDYIVSYLGGDQYWWLPGTTGVGLHQVGSAGFCWTCLQPYYSLDQEQRGLVRHPVTPEEVLGHERAYRCFVCGAGMNKGAEQPHKDVDHTVIWGEETHPRCADCGKGYQTATPEGIDYTPHDSACPAVS